MNLPLRRDKKTWPPRCRPPRPRDDRPIVRVKPHDYQPRKAELEERVNLSAATPEQLGRAIITPVTVIEE